MNRVKICQYLLALGLSCSVQAQTTTPLMHELSAKYKRASPRNEKMKICLEAIDRGLVCRGCPIKNFDTLFGTDFSRYIPAPGKSWETRVLYFTEAPRPLRDDIQAGEVGWYIAVDFNSDGLIQNYRLSNVGK